MIVHFGSDGCSDLLEIHVSVPECATTSGGAAGPAAAAAAGEMAVPAQSGADAECRANAGAPLRLVSPEAEISAATPSELVVAETESTGVSLSAQGSAKAKKAMGKKASKTLPA